MFFQGAWAMLLVNCSRLVACDDISPLIGSDQAYSGKVLFTLILSLHLWPGVIFHISHGLHDVDGWSDLSDMSLSHCVVWNHGQTEFTIMYLVFIVSGSLLYKKLIRKSFSTVLCWSDYWIQVQSEWCEWWSLLWQDSWGCVTSSKMLVVLRAWKK